MDACHYLLIHSNGIGVYHVSPSSDILKHTDIYVGFNKHFHVGHISGSNGKTYTIQFLEGDTFVLTNKHNFHVGDPLSSLTPCHLVRPSAMFPSPLKRQTPIPTAHSPPYQRHISCVTQNHVEIHFMAFLYPSMDKTSFIWVAIQLQ